MLRYTWALSLACLLLLILTGVGRLSPPAARAVQHYILCRHVMLGQGSGKKRLLAMRRQNFIQLVVKTIIKKNIGACPSFPLPPDWVTGNTICDKPTD
jgi:hypothetical protein